MASDSFSFESEVKWSKNCPTTSARPTAQHAAAYKGDISIEGNRYNARLEVDLNTYYDCIT